MTCFRFSSSSGKLSRSELIEDKNTMVRIGLMGIGRHALYAGLRYIPYEDVARVYKRIAMTEGGFSHRGAFMSICYIVIELKNGKSCKLRFPEEEEADMFLSHIAEKAPYIKRMSQAAEMRVAAREEDERRKKAVILDEQAVSLIREMERQKSFLEERPDLSSALSSATRRRWVYNLSRRTLKWLAISMSMIAVAVIIVGYQMVTAGFSSLPVFLFILFLFLFAAAAVYPAARESLSRIEADMDKAEENMRRYVSTYDGFMLDAAHAHPAVFSRLIRILKEKRASGFNEAYSIMQKEIIEIDRNTQVSKEEYDEIVAVKPLFRVERR